MKKYPAIGAQISTDTSLSKIKEIVFASDLSDSEKEDALIYFTKVHHVHQRKIGFQFVAGGATTLISSFFITVLLFHFNYDVHAFMYVSSIAGLSLAFWGVTKIL
jgi:predicted phage tail protein